MSSSIEPPPGWPFTVALTGSAASGKTIAGRMFSALGAAVIEVIVIPDHFQRRIECHRLDPGGVFVSHPPDPSTPLPSLRRLRRLLHGDTSEMPYLVLDVPPMLEAELFRTADRVLWIDIDQFVQLARLQARDGIDEGRARRIRQFQPCMAQGLALADDIIDNSGSREALRVQVGELHHIYRKLAAEPRRSNDK